MTAPSSPSPFPAGMKRRSFLSSALCGVGFVALPVRSTAAQATAAVTPGEMPILDTHPPTEPSGTHVQRVGETKVVFSYERCCPASMAGALENWNGNTSTSMDNGVLHRTPRLSGWTAAGTTSDSTTVSGKVSPSLPRGTCSTRQLSALWMVATSAGVRHSSTAMPDAGVK